MNKIILSLILVISLPMGIFAQSNYSKVKINLQKTNINDVAKQGIDITEGSYRKGVYFTTDMSENEIAKLNTAGIDYEILIPDVKSFYAERAKKGNYEIKRNINDEWPVPQNWEYGSMGGFYNLDEVMNELDDMLSLYPDLITTREVISSDTLTHAGRPIYWVKISDNPNIDEEEPEILYTGVHHAREPIGVQQLIYYMWYLLENYDTDSVVQSIVNNTEMYFVPIVNPDGYNYNWDTDPNGGGMWRKNRRHNDDLTFGVDINRNYGHMWGYDNDGSSPYTYDETYRGPSAFSEPETKNMRDFCNAHNFKLALNYHSYSNLLLYSWGWTPEYPEDYNLFSLQTSIMTVENNYTTGPANTTIYNVNGDSNDWMYGEQDTKDKIFAFVPEVGGDTDGFWPSVDRIIPLCQENMLQNINAARLVGTYAVLSENSPISTNIYENQLQYSIQSIGLSNPGEFSVSLTPLDDNILSVGDNDVFSNLNLMDTETDSISYILAPDIEIGTEFKFLLTVDNGLFTISDTIRKYFGTLVTTFEDPCSTFANWQNYDGWENTEEEFISPYTSITDSRFSDYDDNLNSSVFSTAPIYLYDIDVAFLSFWAKWEIEPNYDYVQVLIKTPEMNDYEPLSGKYTKTGSNEYLEDNIPYYDGTSNWVYEEIDISEYTGSKISIKFLLYTDGYVVADGFYFDDVKVSVITNTTNINENKSNISLSSIYPNPVDNTLKLSYSLAEKKTAKLYIYNTVGDLVFETDLNNTSYIKTIDTQNLPAGMYYLNIKSEGRVSETKKFIKL